MDTKKQYEIFKSLKDTVGKLENLQKSMADKTTDAIIADIEDSNNTAQINPNPGVSSKNSTMMKGKPKDQSKGVHKPYMSDGQSMAGELAREGKNKPGKMGEQNKEVSRGFHKQKLSQLKDIKPNLPKSEIMNKGDSKITIKPHPKPVIDVDPKIISDMKSKIKGANSNAKKPRETVRDHLDDSSHTQIKKGEQAPMLKTEVFIADLKRIRDEIKKQEEETPKFDKLKAFIQKRDEKRNK